MEWKRGGDDELLKRGFLDWLHAIPISFREIWKNAFYVEMGLDMFWVAFN